MSDQINLQFNGELTGDVDAAAVVQNLAKLLKLSEDRAEALMKRSTVIKRNASLADAKRYVQAFRQAGAVLEVVAGDEPATNDEPAAPVEAATIDSNLDLAPEGTAVLEPHERSEEAEYDGAVPDFDVAAAGEDIDPNIEPFEERTFDFGDMSIEPLGEAPPPPTLEPK